MKQDKQPTKLKLFVDFDNTIFNSNQIVVNILNSRYNDNKKLKNLYKYNYKDLFPQVSKVDITNIYDSKELFESLKFVDGAEEVLNNFHELYDIDIVTLGTSDNLNRKIVLLGQTKWMNTFHGNISSSCDKSFIDMSNGILIDDNIECLRSSNAKIKILFRNNHDTEWNKVLPNENIYIVNNWQQIGEILDFYIKLGKIT